jgi:phage FluMu gp28-like protein
VAAVGWGKTRLGALLCLSTGLQRGRAWWVAPSYKMAHVGWRLVTQLAAQIPGAEIKRADQVVALPGGGVVQVRSADNPQALRGEGLDFLVMDECAFIQEAAWAEALRPALSDRLGRALFISTPKGRNWFWRLFVRGQDAGSEFQSWQFPTATNPYIAASEIEAARQSLPERIFQQEYLAMFLDDAGAVFRRVVEAATATEQAEPVAGHRYVIGVDWAQQYDFTVLTVVDMATREVVLVDRFNQVDYVIQSNRLKALYQRFKPDQVIAEFNSIGQPIIERLQREGLPVAPFTTTNASKTAAIDALALAFEQSDIRIPNDPALIGELQAYEMERLPSGLRRFGAPEGMHDDMVMSLALAWQGVVFTPEVAGNPFYDF